VWRVRTYRERLKREASEAYLSLAHFLLRLESIRESVGVGLENRGADRTVRTPPRKICVRFEEHKHTSLILSQGESSGVCADAPRKRHP
jgi:hypothetical protein